MHQKLRGKDVKGRHQMLIKEKEKFKVRKNLNLQLYCLKIRATFLTFQAKLCLLIQAINLELASNCEESREL